MSTIYNKWYISDRRDEVVVIGPRTTRQYIGGRGTSVYLKLFRRDAVRPQSVRTPGRQNLHTQVLGNEAAQKPANTVGLPLGCGHEQVLKSARRWADSDANPRSAG
jgi:hypothetical protein